MMKETLVIILGTGQQVLKNLNERAYKKYIYYVKETDEAFETPFVGEAIINLFNRFDKLVIIGTNNSMWDNLFSYCTDLEDNSLSYNEIDIMNFGKITFAIENAYLTHEHKNCTCLDKNPELLKIIEEKATRKFGISTTCRIIPVADNENQLWEVFKILTEIDFKNEKVSFDITHGLRYQPFFILLSLYYLKSIKEIKIGSIFYGALELSNQSDNKGMAPLLEFKVFSEMMQWINAVNIFSKYKDSDSLANLIGDSNELEVLKETLKKISLSFNMNFFTDIKSNSYILKSELEKLISIESTPYPLRFLKSDLEKVPKAIIECQNNEVVLSLKITENQLKSKNYGLAYLSLWETILYELRNLLNNKFNTYHIQGKLVELIKDNRTSFGDIDKNLIKNIKYINRIRNKIAHFDMKDSTENLEEVKINLESLYQYFSEAIKNNKFQKIADKIKVFIN